MSESRIKLKHGFTQIASHLSWDRSQRPIFYYGHFKSNRHDPCCHEFKRNKRLSTKRWPIRVIQCNRWARLQSFKSYKIIRFTVIDRSSATLRIYFQCKTIVSQKAFPEDLHIRVHWQIQIHALKQRNWLPISNWCECYFETNCSIVPWRCQLEVKQVLYVGRSFTS